MNFCAKIAVVLLSLLGFQAHLSAQQVMNFPANRDANLKIDGLLNGADESYHTGFKPLMRRRVANTEFLDFDADTSRYYYRITQKMYKDHLLQVNEEKLTLTADILFNFEFGFDATDTSANDNYQNKMLLNNTRGFIVEGQIGKRIAFSSSFYENQFIGVDYIFDYADSLAVMPSGQGRVKVYKDGAGWDYAMSSAYLSYTPFRRLNLQFGHQKNFVGDGYRSLLLSDNTFNYPGLKISALFGATDQFQYTSVFASMQTLTRFSEHTTPEALFLRKTGSFHHLSWNATTRLQLGLFEGVVWRRVVDSTEALTFDYTYFIPVLGVNTAINGFAGDNNAVMGLNAKFRIKKSMYLYGQLMLDDPKNNRLGFQLGTRLFNIKGVDGFCAQFEFNRVMPYTYAHVDPMQNYSHYNQSLAHPIGAGFGEAVGILNYKIKNTRWFTRLQFNAAVYDEGNTDNNTGRDIFRSLDDRQDETSGTVTNLIYSDIQLGYQMLHATNLQFVTGFTFRNLATGDNTHTTTYLYFGLRTNLTNKYYDF